LQKHHKTVKELGVLRETVFRLTMDRTALINHSDIYREWCPGSSSVCSRWTVSRDVAGPQWCRHRVIISSQHLRRFRLLRHSVI